MAVKNHILKNLHSLIRNSALTYMNEFVWQDFELTEEFKKIYTTCLQSSRYEVEFLGATAVITTPSAKYIFVPNQWFVMASYAVDVYEELNKYKKYFKAVSDKLHKKIDSYAKSLRDGVSVMERNEFTDCARGVFSLLYTDDSMVEESVSRLWRFVTDYAWWSGQKTIDRGDFFVSVILNMLNLVNVSQGYVADIVYAYANNYELRRLVRSIDEFTVNGADLSTLSKHDYTLPDEEIVGQEDKSCRNEDPVIPKPDRVKIKINGTSTLKEIKYKG